jgi:hypothetical protein
MAHYAQVIDGKVVDVIVADPEFIAEYATKTEGEWLQTSYNTVNGVHVDPVTREPDGGEPLRYNYAEIGGNYDAVADVFYSAQPFPSWSLNTANYTWEAPIPKPDLVDGVIYYLWIEELYQADNATGWIPVKG